MSPLDLTGMSFRANGPFVTVASGLRTANTFAEVHAEPKIEFARLLATLLNDLVKGLEQLAPEDRALDFSYFVGRDGGRMSPASMGEEE